HRGGGSSDHARPAFERASIAAAPLSSVNEQIGFRVTSNLEDPAFVTRAKPTRPKNRPRLPAHGLAVAEQQRGSARGRNIKQDVVPFNPPRLFIGPRPSTKTIDQ